MRKIFISYRRAEAEYPAGALGRELRHYFGDEQVFRDKEDIGGGVSWRQEILHEIGKDSTLLVLIGENWTNAEDADGRRRLDNTNDPLRLEITEGLKEGAVIIPILLENAHMPTDNELPQDLRSLGDFNALKLRDGDWRYDLDKIFNELKKLGFKQVNSPPQAQRQEHQATQKNLFSWSNPVVLLLLTSVISASGWAINKFVERDRSNLRFEAQGITQAINLASPESPIFEGEPVFCDTAKLTLLLAHNGKGQRPVLVNSIAMKVEQLKPQNKENSVDCSVDTLSSKPFGIVLKNTYVLDIASTGNSGRFIESELPDAAHVINPDNILDIANKKQVITLKPEEEPIVYDVFVEAITRGLYRVWFSADYDAAGSHKTTTRSFVIGK